MKRTFRPGWSARPASAIEPAGKPDVGDEQVDTNARLQDPQRRSPVRRLDAAVAGIGEHVGDEHADGRLVVDHQHDLAPDGCWPSAATAASGLLVNATAKPSVKLPLPRDRTLSHVLRRHHVASSRRSFSRNDCGKAGHIKRRSGSGDHARERDLLETSRSSLPTFKP